MFFCCDICFFQFRNMIDAVKRRTTWKTIDEIKIEGDYRGRNCVAIFDKDSYSFFVTFKSNGEIQKFDDLDQFQSIRFFTSRSNRLKFSLTDKPVIIARRTEWNVFTDRRSNQRESQFISTFFSFAFSSWGDVFFRGNKNPAANRPSPTGMKTAPTANDMELYGYMH